MTLPNYKFWKKHSAEYIKKRVFDALNQNVDFAHNNLLGVPASSLDDMVFYNDAPFLSDAPFLASLVKNPNHIGCHTLGSSESYFAGTQKIEKELIDICSVDILKAEKDSCDGYVAAGGTEANLQAIWIYRNYFIRERNAKHDEICILFSEDSHYSMFKAGNLMNITAQAVKVKEATRKIDHDKLTEQILSLKEQGVKYFVVVANMMTTMFGSVDNPDTYALLLRAAGVEFKMHVDGAYGGFMYPFTDSESKLTFRNPDISSFTLDAHKLVQAPYGTGIFVARKGLIKYVYTDEAEYVKGLDATLSGSRSGANAIAVWMILTTYGPFGWHEKNQILLMRTAWLCEQLDSMNVKYYRNEFSNIVTIRGEHVSHDLAKNFGLVPDSHDDNPSWFKIVVMGHVTVEKLSEFLIELNPNK